MRNKRDLGSTRNQRDFLKGLVIDTLDGQRARIGNLENDKRYRHEVKHAPPRQLRRHPTQNLLDISASPKVVPRITAHLKG